MSCSLIPASIQRRRADIEREPVALATPGKESSQRLRELALACYPCGATRRQNQVMSPQTSKSLYELAFRESDEIEVALLWNGAERSLLLNVRDRRSGQWFVLALDSAEALDAYRHPFAYIAQRDADAGEVSTAA
jgi:hypothetical protein